MLFLLLREGMVACLGHFSHGEKIAKQNLELVPNQMQSHSPKNVNIDIIHCIIAHSIHIPHRKNVLFFFASQVISLFGTKFHPFREKQKRAAACSTLRRAFFCPATTTHNKACLEQFFPLHAFLLGNRENKLRQRM